MPWLLAWSEDVWGFPGMSVENLQLPTLMGTIMLAAVATVTIFSVIMPCRMPCLLPPSLQL